MVSAAQPLAVEQVSASQFASNSGTGQPIDGFLVGGLGCLSPAEQCPATRLDAQCPVCAGGLSRLGDPRVSVDGGVALIIDELALLIDLQDVYWAREGRSSVDAAIGLIAAGGVYLAGASFWHRAAHECVRTCVDTALGNVRPPPAC